MMYLAQRAARRVAWLYLNDITYHDRIFGAEHSSTWVRKPKKMKGGTTNQNKLHGESSNEVDHVALRNKKFLRTLDI